MDIAVVCIALGEPYIRLWRSLHEQLSSVAGLDANVRMHMLTDDQHEAQALLATETVPKPVPVEFHEAPPLRWPLATLLRYQLMRQIWGKLEADVVMYLDVDMLAQGDWTQCMSPETWSGGIALVRHPGYPSRSRAIRSLAHGTSSRHLFRPLATSVVKNEPGLGAWERRPISMAFVPRTARRVYVHGAVWMGAFEPLGDLVDELADRTATDLEAGVIARFHDESHLNWWASRNPFTLLSGRFSAVERWRYTSPDDALLLSVDKDPALHSER